MNGCQKPSLAQRMTGLSCSPRSFIVSISSSSSRVPIPPGSATKRSADSVINCFRSASDSTIFSVPRSAAARSGRMRWRGMIPSTSPPAAAAARAAIPISPRPLPPYTRRSPRPAQAAPNSAASERAATGRSSTAEQNRHTECLAMSDPDECVEADVHRRCLLCNSAHRDEIDSGLGDGAQGLQLHATGGLERNPTTRERDRAPQVFQTHVVEQNHVGPRLERVLHLLERVAFDHMSLEDL